MTVHSGTPVTQVFTDTDQVLNTGGVDPASCGGLEEHGWDRATPGQS